MEEFSVIQPASALAPYIKNYWLLKTAAGVNMHNVAPMHEDIIAYDGNPAHSSTHEGNTLYDGIDITFVDSTSAAGSTPAHMAAAVARTVPTGMISLIFHRGDRLFSVRENAFHPRAFLSGQDRTFTDLLYRGQVNMISVVFRPAGVRAFFDLPINRLTGLLLSSGDLEDRELAALERSLTSTEDDEMCISLIEQFLLRRLMRLSDREMVRFPGRQSMRPNEHNLRRIASTIRLIDSGEANVSSLADAACLSRKQFDRIFSEHVGANPKEFSRTVRFQRALHTLETDPDIGWAALAAHCGYFDQSHMIREFRALSGYTPGEYISVCPPHSDYFDLGQF